MPENLYGMNRYMYVDANPVKWTDPSGNKSDDNIFSKLGGELLIAVKLGDHKNISFENARGGLAWANSGFNGNKAKERRRNDAPGRFWDSTIGKDGLGGWLDTKIFATPQWRSFWSTEIYQEDYKRIVIKSYIQERVCEKEGSDSIGCLVIQGVNLRVTEPQEKKFLRAGGWQKNGEASFSGGECTGTVLVMNINGKKEISCNFFFVRNIVKSSDE